MKKLIAFATVLIFAASFTLEAQTIKYMFTGVYNLEFTDQVMIQVGGAKQNKSTSEWEGGSKVGKHTITPEMFEELQGATSSKFKMEIEKKKIGTLRGIQVTDLSTGKVMKGIYNEQDRKFTFGSSKTTKQGGATKTDMGVVTGKLSADKSTIEKGEFGVGFIAGKSPHVITARAVFYYSATLAE